jgi:hypothetical protein
VGRDSLYGERIIWRGRPKAVSVPFTYRVAALVFAVVSVITLSFAVVAARSLHVHIGSMVVFAAWCATLALAAWRGPLVWRSRVEYLVTDKHVIWRRGPIRRSIARSQISYSLIRWHPRDRSRGDLLLVRAVPTGALRRTLHLTLQDVDEPDRVWALVRGVAPSPSLGRGDRPLAQRLDDAERVLWTAIPLASPWTVRRAATAAVAGLVLATFVHSILRAVPPVLKLLRLHALPPAMSAVLVAGVGLGCLLLLAVALGGAWVAFVRPVLLARSTRYFVTNRRVLIRRGHEELALDRSRIAYVIDAPQRPRSDGARPKLHDVFLVLDGPQARALAPSGAFGEGGTDSLKPVFTAIVDADRVEEILRAA